MAAKGQTLAEFGELYPAERKLLTACRDGEVAEISTTRPDAPIPGNRVRADFIQFLARGGDMSVQVHANGIRLQGAVIVGNLDLQSVKIMGPLWLVKCQFLATDGDSNSVLILRDAHVGGLLALDGSALEALVADGIRVKSDLFARDNFSANMTVDLIEAEVGGQLSFRGSKLSGSEIALDFSGSTIIGGVFLDELVTTGKVIFLLSEIRRQLSIKNSEFNCVELALNFSNTIIRGGVFLTNSQAWGPVKFTGARIEGQLSLNYAKLNGNKVSLSFDNAIIMGDVFLDDCVAQGEVRFIGTKIEGQLSGVRGKFDYEKDSLSFDGAIIEESVFLLDCQVSGRARFLGAEIGGQLVCNSGCFNGSEIALTFDGAVIKDGVFLDNCIAEGTVKFSGAQIDGPVSAKGAKFNKTGVGLGFDGAVIKDGVIFDGCSAQGEVRFLGAEIRGNLSCLASKLKNSSGNALNGEHARIFGSLLLGPLISEKISDFFESQGRVNLIGAEIRDNLHIEAVSLKGGVDFSFVTVGKEFRLRGRQAVLNQSKFHHMRCLVLNDDPSVWGVGNKLNGFEYKALGDNQSAATVNRSRIDWLERQMPLSEQESYRPQPWRHLQKTLKAMGQYAEALEIGIAHEKFRYALGKVGELPPEPKFYDKLSAPLTRGLHRIYGALAGYGYKPLKLVLFSVGIWFICSWVYWFSALAGYLGPTNPIVFQNPKYGYKEKNCIYERQEFCISVPLDNWYWLPSLPAEYTTFSPMAYSLDLILPLVDLGQEKDWGVLVPTPKKVPVEEILHFSWGHILRLVVWFEILWGWVASLMLVAVISGLVRNTRDDE